MTTDVLVVTFNILQTFYRFVPIFLQICANYLINVGYNPYRREREVARW